MARVIDLLPDVAQIVRKAPDVTLIGAYVRAARKFCRESRWYRSQLTGATLADRPVYNLGSDPLLEILGIKAVSCAPRTGNRRPYPLPTSDTGGWVAGQPTGRPRRCAYVPEAQLAINPTPDAVYDLTVTLVLQPKAGVVEIPDDLLVKWDQVLQAGALAYLLAIPDQPWTDKTTAQIKAREFQAGINNARADEQRQHQAGTQFIRTRPFVVGGIRMR